MGVGRVAGGRAGLGPRVRGNQGVPGGDVTVGEWEGGVRGGGVAGGGAGMQPAEVAIGRRDCDVREASYLATMKRTWGLGGM